MLDTLDQIWTLDLSQFCKFCTKLLSLKSGQLLRLGPNGVLSKGSTVVFESIFLITVLNFFHQW